MAMDSPEQRQIRANVLAEFGAQGAVAEELLAYGGNRFQKPAFQLEAFPLEDEPFVAAWRSYAEAVSRQRSFEALREFLVQLNFPVEDGMSGRPEYLAAVQSGRFPALPQKFEWRAPGEHELTIHGTPAGHIPVLTMYERRDFEDLTRALTKRNEPAPIPPSMGATMVAGYADWHRIHLFRRQYERDGGTDWPAEFARVKQRRDLYQDRFILLSTGPYSGVPAQTLGLDPKTWENLSITIRREHECAHYFTKRVFGSMQNTLFDELIADYCGIATALGRFDPHWLLLFFGLERFPQYREGGRLQNYRGTPGLSDEAFRLLQRLVVEAAQQLKSFDGYRVMRGVSPVSPEVFFALGAASVEEIAASSGAATLNKALDKLQVQAGQPERAAAHV